MWAPLQHPDHVNLYEELQRCRVDRKEDWQPMIRAIHYLQGRPYAVGLFAFTSLASFHVTTAHSYAEFRGHHTVGISWSPEKRIFSLSFGESWVSQREHERVCEESDLPASVDSLIQGMLLENEAGSA